MPTADDPAHAPRVLVYRSSLLSASETFVLDQVQALQRWQPTLVGEWRVQGLALPPGLPVTLLSQGQQRSLRRWRRGAARLFNRPLRADVQRLGPLGASLLHAHFGTDAVDIAPLARVLRLPLVVTLHGFDIHTSAAHWQTGAAGWGMRSYPARLRRLAAQHGVRFIAVSADVQRAAIAFGIAPQRIAVLPIGIDLQRFAPAGAPLAQRARLVVFVGRLVEKKGCRHLLDAMASTPLRDAGAQLLVIGDGPLRGALEAQARTLGLAARFVGACTPAQVKHWLDQARALCLPSVTAASGDAEGFGLVLLEAQACGVPVVSSARGGREDGLVDGETGFAVGEGDVPALASALHRLLTDDARAQRMSAAGRRFVLQRMDLQHCTAALEALYDEVAGRVDVSAKAAQASQAAQTQQTAPTSQAEQTSQAAQPSATSPAPGTAAA